MPPKSRFRSRMMKATATTCWPYQCEALDLVVDRALGALGGTNDVVRVHAYHQEVTAASAAFQVVQVEVVKEVINPEVRPMTWPAFAHSFTRRRKTSMLVGSLKSTIMVFSLW